MVQFTAQEEGKSREGRPREWRYTTQKVLPYRAEPVHSKTQCSCLSAHGWAHLHFIVDSVCELKDFGCVTVVRDRASFSSL